MVVRLLNLDENIRVFVGTIKLDIVGEGLRALPIKIAVRSTINYSLFIIHHSFFMVRRGRRTLQIVV